MLPAVVGSFLLDPTFEKQRMLPVCKAGGTTEQSAIP